MPSSTITDIPICTQLFANKGISAPDGNQHLHRLALQRSYLWPNGSTLRVGFIGGSSIVQEKVKQYAVQWSIYANITLDFVTAGDTDIRVAFEQNGRYNSYVGTESKLIAQDQRTMNLSLTDNEIEDIYSRRILHEFGHALGCLHEHQNPAANIPWDMSKIYEFYKKESNWSPEEVNQNVLTPQAADTANFTAFDPKSIMLYPLPGILTNNLLVVDWNYSLSDTDKDFIAKCYPRTHEFGTYQVDSPDPGSIGNGEKNSKTISFSKPESTPPKVITGMRMLDMANNAPTWIIRAMTSADNISGNEFTAHIDTWDDSRMYDGGASWMKFPANDIDFQCGFFDLASGTPGGMPERTIFPKPFSTQPRVFVCISGINIGGDWHVRVSATEVDKTGFVLRFLNWGNCTQYNVRASWIAFPVDKPGVVMGEFNSGDNKGFSGHVNFGNTFSKPPQVFAALDGFDIDHDHNLRVKLVTDSITSSGMDWKIESWADTKLNLVGGSYLAVAT